MLARQSEVHRRQWLRAGTASDIAGVPLHALGGAISDVETAFRSDGYSVALLDFMHELAERLGRAGVTFRDERLSEARIDELARGEPVVTAMGAQEQARQPAAT